MQARWLDHAPKVMAVSLDRRISYDRQCWVCFGTPEDDETGQQEWTSPCRCCGGTKWVHQTCLQLWVDEKQKMSSSVAVSCPQCQYTYRIQYPRSNILLYLYDYIDRGITLSSPMILAGITAATLYWASFTYGFTATTLALGTNNAIKFFRSPESTLAVVCLPIIPWVIVTVKILRPEVVILKFWYKHILPVIARICKNMPITNQISFSTRRQVFQPAEVQPFPYIARTILSMITLPFISSSIGHLLFRFTDNGVKRMLMGCATYLLFDYALKVTLELHRGRIR